MTVAMVAAILAGVCVTVAPVLVVVARRYERAVTVSPRWRRKIVAAVAASRVTGHGRRQTRLRMLVWFGIGVAVWAVTGWATAGAAVAAGGLWTPWLLGSGRVAHERIDRLEAMEGWCRRMADTLAGGGAVGLAQAIAVSADHVDASIAGPVANLADALRNGTPGIDAAAREFADQLDDRVADAVAAAVLLALRQQSAGVARILRQLADGVARDVRARRDIEAARAESRQSIRMLLIIQAAVLVMLALVPTFAAPYSTAGGQLVMAALLAATVALLIWMRQLALGHPSPRFLGSGATS